MADASYEGGLYGLIGLSIKNNTEFNRAVDVYKARHQRPERPNNISLGTAFCAGVKALISADMMKTLTTFVINQNLSRDSAWP